MVSCVSSIHLCGQRWWGRRRWWFIWLARSTLRYRDCCQCWAGGRGSARNPMLLLLLLMYLEGLPIGEGMSLLCPRVRGGDFVIALHYQYKSTFEGLYKHFSGGDFFFISPRSFLTRGWNQCFPVSLLLKNLGGCRECEVRWVACIEGCIID